MYPYLVSLGVFAILISSPAVGQRPCNNAPVVLRLEIHQQGTRDRHLGPEHEEWGRSMDALLRKRCKGCIWQGDAYTFQNAKNDDEFVITVVAPQATAESSTPEVPRTTATLILSIIHKTYDDAVLEVSWERQRDTLETLGRANRPLKHSAIQGNEDRLFSQLLDDLRASNERLSCLITASRSRRTVNMARFGLWATELLTERDFATQEDLRMQHFAVGRWIDREIFPMLDFRLRGEVGAGWPYFTDSGRLFERNGGGMTVPVLAASIGGGAVLYPLPSRPAFVPYLFAGADVVYHMGQDYTADRTTWRPEFSFPSQPGWAANIGLGVAKPYPVELLGRWSQPTVRFIGDSRTPTVFDLSIALGVPAFPRLH